MNFETVIFSAGQGTRLGDMGAKVPKALLPVWLDNGSLEPILLRIMKQACLAKTSKIYIVVNHMKSHIVKFVKRNSWIIDIPLDFVEQNDLNGEAGGLFLIEDIKSPILAIDGDNYLSDNYFFKKLVENYFESECYATIGIRNVPDIHRYANVKITEDNILEDIIEKPYPGTEFSKLAKMGCYVLSNELINLGQKFFQDSQGEITTTAGFSNACLKHKKINCLEYKGGYLDIGTLDAYASHLIERAGGANEY